MGLAALVSLASCGSGADAPAGAFTTSSFQTMPGRFDQVLAEEQMRSTFPEADETTIATALEIARNACIVAGYETTAEGTSAVFALRRTDHGGDAIEVALRAGCPNTGNYEPFLVEVENVDSEE